MPFRDAVTRDMEATEIKHIGVIGAGAIGCLVAGYLSQKGHRVSLAARPAALRALAERGLYISGVRGELSLRLEVAERLPAKPDLVLLATKVQDIEGAVKDNREAIEGALVLTVQNGVRADRILASYIPAERIISSVVMFVATGIEPGRVVHNAEGAWVLGSTWPGSAQERAAGVSRVLGEAFDCTVSDDLRGMKYLKLFVNANNCLAALLGQPLQEAFADLEISRLSLAIWREGFALLSALGVSLSSLPGFALDNLTRLLSMPPQEAAQVWSGIMRKLGDYPVYGSILQSIQRGRASEIDYINGEFVALAQENGLAAPLNARLVQMVHQVEATGRFYNREELLASAREADGYG